MELNLYFEICRETVCSIMISVVLIVVTVCMMKHAIISTKCDSKQLKNVKEVEPDDNRGNQKRSTKTDVH